MEDAAAGTSELVGGMAVSELVGGMVVSELVGSWLVVRALGWVSYRATVKDTAARSKRVCEDTARTQ